MKRKSYSINPAKIGNQQGWRLPISFYQDNPHLAETSGLIEVLNEDTLLVRLDTKKTIQEEEEESLMMSLFLDFLMKDVIANPEKLVPYTETMSRSMDNLLADVIVEENENNQKKMANIFSELVANENFPEDMETFLDIFWGDKSPQQLFWRCLLLIAYCLLLIVNC